MIGRSRADEYIAPCAAGENGVALAPGYAANVEVARPTRGRSSCLGARRPRGIGPPVLTKVEEVSGPLGLPARAIIKAMPIVVEGRGLVLVLLRGDQRLNEIKLRNGMGDRLSPARPEEIEARAAPGRLPRTGGSATSR